MPDAAGAPHLHPPAAPTPDAAGEFARLMEIMRLLRSAEGCPWDREQSWSTLKPYVLEEAYEVVDAIDRSDAADLCGEIGDLVFEGVFLSRVAEDNRLFTMADALRAVSEKLIRRHPHVFFQADASEPTVTGVTTPGAVIDQWEQIKARERAVNGKTHASALDGLPLAAPALTRAYELGERAAKVGFDWPGADAVLDKAHEEIDELRHEVVNRRADRLAEELGDLFFALAQFARKSGIDPEAALRAANAKFSGRFRRVEQRVAAQGRVMGSVPIDDLEVIWQQVKTESEE